MDVKILKVFKNGAITRFPQKSYNATRTTYGITFVYQAKVILFLYANRTTTQCGQLKPKKRFVIKMIQIYSFFVIRNLIQ